VQNILSIITVGWLALRRILEAPGSIFGRRQLILRDIRGAASRQVVAQ